MPARPAHPTRAAPGGGRRGSPRPATPACAAGRCSWPGASCCSRRTARWRSGSGRGPRTPAAEHARPWSSAGAQAAHRAVAYGDDRRDLRWCRIASGDLSGPAGTDHALCLAARFTLRCRAADTIRGGGDPTPAWLASRPRNGPAAPELRRHAHGCIVVRIQRDRPNTSLWRDDPRPTASSPQIVSRRKAKSERREAAANAMGLTPYAP